MCAHDELEVVLLSSSSPLGMHVVCHYLRLHETYTAAAQPRALTLFGPFRKVMRSHPALKANTRISQLTEKKAPTNKSAALTQNFKCSTQQRCMYLRCPRPTVMLKTWTTRIGDNVARRVLDRIPSSRVQSRSHSLTSNPQPPSL